MTATTTHAIWSRLSIRLVPVHLAGLASPVALLFASLLLTGGALTLQVLITAAALFVTVLVVSGIGLMRFITTRYRISADMVEVRSGFLFRSRRSLTINKVRSIDVTANLVYRVFGLTTLRIDTGEQGAASGRILALDGISAGDADALRTAITRARDSTIGRASDQVDGTIAELDWSWIHYGPLTVWGVGGVFVVAGTGMRILSEMKVNPLELAVVVDLQQRFGSVPAWFGILAVVLLIISLGVVASIAAFVENWNKYRLERDDDGDFRLRRGLIVTRAISIEAQRMSGIEVTEPLLLRLARGARIDAIASGLGNREDNRRRRRLSPPMPRSEALRIAATVTGEKTSPTNVALTRHPARALRRRLRWGILATGIPAAVLVALMHWVDQDLVPLGLACAAAALPTGALIGWASFLSLGHAVNGRYLITRAGLFPRRTSALARTDIIGWRISCSPGQRRAGLVTLAATTAAGEGIQKIRDIAAHDAVDLAEDAMPEPLAPFAFATFHEAAR